LVTAIDYARSALSRGFQVVFVVDCCCYVVIADCTFVLHCDYAIACGYVGILLRLFGYGCSFALLRVVYVGCYVICLVRWLRYRFVGYVVAVVG
jgi:hypothetical protein